MPSYDYQCKKCGKVWEYYQHSYREEHNATNCPTCGSKRIIRQFPAPAAHITCNPNDARYNRGKGGGKKKIVVNEGFIKPNTDESVGPIHYKHTLESP